MRDWVQGTIDELSLYDWGRTGDLEGLIRADGTRRTSYYTMRLGIRALQGGRSTLLTTSSNPNLMAIATQDQNHLYLLMVNSESTPARMDIDLSAFDGFTSGTVWQFSPGSLDEMQGRVTQRQGQTHLEMSATSGLLIQFGI